MATDKGYLDIIERPGGDFFKVRSTLGELKDVSVSNLSNGQILRYSSTNGWENYTASEMVNTDSTIYCNDADSVKAKSGTCAFNFNESQSGWYKVYFKYGNNTNSSGTTVSLSINGGTAKPIKLNGNLITTSNLNCVFPWGMYDAYYDGSYWYLNSPFKSLPDRAIISFSSDSQVTKFAGSLYPFSITKGNYPFWMQYENTTGNSKFYINGTEYENSNIHVNGLSYTGTRSMPAGWNYPYFDGTDWWFRDDGKMTAAGYAIPSGTSSQFLKANGSIDTNTYLVSDDIKQSNFKEFDSTSKAYIKAKPEFSNGTYSELLVPGEYKQLDYVYNTSAETGVAIDTNKTWIDGFEVEITSISHTTGYWRIFGNNGTSGDPATCITGNDGSIDLWVNGTKIITSSITRTFNHIYTVRVKLKSNIASFYVKDETTGDEDYQIYDYTSIGLPTTLNNAILWRIKANRCSANNKIYRLQCWQDGAKTVDWIPASLYNSSTETTIYGFWDRISNTFKTNSYVAGGNEVDRGTALVIPTNVSAFINDAGYITSTSVPTIFGKSNVELSSTAQAVLQVDGSDSGSVKLPVASSSKEGIMKLGATGGAATFDHIHGNIQNGGTLQTNDITIASGDKLVITDATDSNKIARSSITFDGSSENKFLTPKGTWKDATLDNISDGSTRKLSNYLPLAGGAMTGAITRTYSNASDDPFISIASDNKDIWLWRVRDNSYSGVSAAYGFGAKYIGTGTGDDNNYVFYADNKTGTQKEVLTINQPGNITIHTKIKGPVTFSTTTQAYTSTEGLNFETSNETTSAHIGATNGSLGMYCVGSIYLRPNQTTIGEQDQDANKGLAINITSITYNGNTVWHAGNDGSGSGLDADLLDGHHASYFATASSVPAAANDGKLKVQANSGTASDMFSADQSGNSTLKFVNGTNTTVTQSTSSGTTTVTINATDTTYSFGPLGSTTKPIYLHNTNTFEECSTYAGGTAVTLNGTSAAAGTASFYAPLDQGADGEFLMSSGVAEPKWSSLPIASTSDAGIMVLGASGGAATFSHTHGTINNNGTITGQNSQTGSTVTNNQVTIAKGDRLVIGDYSAQSSGNFPLKLTTIVFGNDSGTYLKNDGTWTTPTDTNQTVKVGNSTFGSDDVVEIVGGTNITVTADTTNKTITIGNTTAPLTSWSNSDNYAFKTITVKTQSTATSVVAGNLSDANLTATSNTDTLNLASGNQWIQINSTTSKTATFGHYVGTIGDGGDLKKISLDKAGHITATSKAILDDLSDVKISSPINHQFLTYNGTTGAWNNESIVIPNAANNGKLKVQANSGTADDMFGADQSGNSTLKFVDGTNTTVSQSTSNGTTTVTINATDPGNGTLTLKGQYTGTSGTTSDSNGNSLFTANASTGSTLTITGSNGIKTYRGTASGTTNTITINHTNSITASGATYKGSTTKVAKIQYDAQGHITACEEVNIAFPNDEKVKQNVIVSSDTNEYPLLATGTTDPAGTAQEANYSSTKLNKDGDIVFNGNSTKCSLHYDSTNLCLNIVFE